MKYCTHALRICQSGCDGCEAVQKVLETGCSHACKYVEDDFSFSASSAQHVYWQKLPAPHENELQDIQLR